MVLGVEQEIVVLEFAGGLSVTLPMQRAREQLRPLVSEADVRRVQETLREDGALSADVWVKGLRPSRRQLRGGDPLELAEIVRDGARRERMLSGNEAPPRPDLAHTRPYNGLVQALQLRRAAADGDEAAGVHAVEVVVLPWPAGRAA